MKNIISFILSLNVLTLFAFVDLTIAFASNTETQLELETSKYENDAYLEKVISIDYEALKEKQRKAIADRIHKLEESEVKEKEKSNRTEANTDTSAASTDEGSNSEEIPVTIENSIEDEATAFPELRQDEPVLEITPREEHIEEEKNLEKSENTKDESSEPAEAVEKETRSNEAVSTTEKETRSNRRKQKSILDGLNITFEKNDNANNANNEDDLVENQEDKTTPTSSENSNSSNEASTTEEIIEDEEFVAPKEEEEEEEEEEEIKLSPEEQRIINLRNACITMEIDAGTLTGFFSRKVTSKKYYSYEIDNGRGSITSVIISNQDLDEFKKPRRGDAIKLDYITLQEFSEESKTCIQNNYYVQESGTLIDASENKKEAHYAFDNYGNLLDNDRIFSVEKVAEDPADKLIIKSLQYYFVNDFPKYKDLFSREAPFYNELEENFRYSKDIEEIYIHNVGEISGQESANINRKLFDKVSELTFELNLARVKIVKIDYSIKYSKTSRLRNKFQRKSYFYLCGQQKGLEWKIFDYYPAEEVYKPDFLTKITGVWNIVSDDSFFKTADSRLFFELMPAKRNQPAKLRTSMHGKKFDNYKNILKEKEINPNLYTFAIKEEKIQSTEKQIDFPHLLTNKEKEEENISQNQEGTLNLHEKDEKSAFEGAIQNFLLDVKIVDTNSLLPLIIEVQGEQYYFAGYSHEVAKERYERE